MDACSCSLAVHQKQIWVQGHWVSGAVRLRAVDLITGIRAFGFEVADKVGWDAGAPSTLELITLASTVQLVTVIATCIQAITDTVLGYTTPVVASVETFGAGQHGTVNDIFIRAIRTSLDTITGKLKRNASPIATLEL